MGNKKLIKIIVMIIVVTMIVLIAVLMGVYDIGALILIFGLNASMNLFGLLMEKINLDNKKVNWLPFIYGSVAGIIPWIILFMYAFGNSNPAEVRVNPLVEVL